MELKEENSPLEDGRIRRSLSTWWEYRVNGGPAEQKKVPFSALCVGESECRLDFSAPDGPPGRVLLCLEGITYAAEIELNGRFLGEMRPYCTYDFDVTGLLSQAGNTLTVSLRDMGLPFGPAEGWENYSGIIRDVYLQYIPDVYIKDYCWRPVLSGDFRRAQCHLEVFPDGKDLAGYAVKARLFDGGACVAETGAAEDFLLEWTVENPCLWSPDSPHLYTLEIQLLHGGQTLDVLRERVGFKELRKEGNRFLLNGEPYFLIGVCRHDTWGHDSGHTLTEEQMRRDMQMIKNTGANYVRLVHYPHNRRIVELADELGLLVSEEPGLWDSDLTDPAVTAAALEVLERTVRRDRNRVSVAFWLAFNECRFTPEFLADAAAVCRRLDTRMVSGANFMNLKRTKELFTEQQIDFYTFHPYGDQTTSVTAGVDAETGPVSLRTVFEVLDDKPLVFTEWGGWPVMGNPTLFGRFMDAMFEAGRNGEKGKTLAGMAYWSWADMYETNRGLPACRDGILNEGLVDVNRNPRANLDVFTRKIAERGMTCARPSGRLKVLNACAAREGADYRTVPLPAEDDDAVWQSLLKRAESLLGRCHKKARRLTHGPALPEECRSIGTLPADLRQGRPLVIQGAAGEWEIPVGFAANALYFIGQASILEGYPLCGEKGAEAARYDIVFEDGGVQSVPLRNGIEFASAFGLAGPSRIDPRARRATRTLAVSYDLNWEVYYLNTLRVEIPGNRPVRCVRIQPLLEEYALLLYGITAETLGER